MGLWIRDCGINKDLIQRGIEQAQAKLKEMGVSEEEAFEAHQACSHCSKYDHAAELAWERAELAAFTEVFRDLPRWPETARMIYH